MHLHQILCQSTCFIRTNHSDSAHRLASVHLSYEVVSREHTAHIQRQAEGDAHRQTFGHGHYNQSNRHHKVLECPLENGKPFMPSVQCAEIKVEQYIFHEENKESESCNGKADFSNQVG